MRSLKNRIARLERCRPTASSWEVVGTSEEVDVFLAAMCARDYPYEPISGSMIPRVGEGDGPIAPAFLAEYRALLMRMHCLREEGETWSVNFTGWYGAWPRPIWVLI